MDQVILVVRNPRHALVEYHDILHDIDYANNAADAYAKEGNVYRERAPLEKYLEWRDSRTIYEINWWGKCLQWFLSFWLFLIAKIETIKDGLLIIGWKVV